MSCRHLPLGKMDLASAPPTPAPPSGPDPACSEKQPWVESSCQVQHQPGLPQPTGSALLGRAPWPGRRNNISLYRGSRDRPACSHCCFWIGLASLGHGNMRQGLKEALVESELRLLSPHVTQTWRPELLSPPHLHL